MRQDNVYNKLNHVSETLATNIDILQYILNATTKEGDEFNVNKFIPIEALYSVTESSIDGLKLMLFTIKKFTEKGNARLAHTPTVSEVTKNLLKLRTCFHLESEPMRPIVLKFMLTLLDFRKIVLKELNLLLPFEYQRELYLGRIWSKNEILKKNIQNTQERLACLEKEHRVVTDKRRKRIKVLENMLKNPESTYEDRVDQILYGFKVLSFFLNYNE